MYRAEIGGVLFKLSRADASKPWLVRWYDDTPGVNRRTGVPYDGRWVKVGSSPDLSEASEMAVDHSRKAVKR